MFQLDLKGAVTASRTRNTHRYIVRNAKGWFPYDRGSQIAIRSAIVCDHMETTSAIAIAEDRTMFYLKAGFHMIADLIAICDPRSYGNQP